MAELARISITVTGHVQGVYYRAFASRIAKSLGLRGFVHNVPRSGAVEIQAEGDKEKLEDLARQLEVGPPEALVENMDVRWEDFRGEFVNFEIR